MRKRQRQNLLPHGASFTDDRMTEYAPTLIPLLFFRAPKLLTIDYNELFDVTTEDPTDPLTSAPADDLPWAAHQNVCTHERLCFFSTPNIATCSFINISTCVHEGMCVCRAVPSVLYNSHVRPRPVS